MLRLRAYAIRDVMLYACRCPPPMPACRRLPRLPRSVVAARFDTPYARHVARCRRADDFAISACHAAARVPLRAMICDAAAFTRIVRMMRHVRSRRDAAYALRYDAASPRAALQPMPRADAASRASRLCFTRRVTRSCRHAAPRCPRRRCSPPRHRRRLMMTDIFAARRLIRAPRHGALMIR